MELRRAITLKNFTIEEAPLQPTDKEPKIVLAVRGPIDADIADALGCKEMFFDRAGLPREFTGSVGLPLQVKDADVELPGQNGQIDHYRSEFAGSFRVVRDEGPDARLKLKCRMHFTGAAVLGRIFEFFLAWNKAEFVMGLTPAQMELPFNQAPASPEPAELDTGCIACNNEIPLLEPGKHASGSDCTKLKGKAHAAARA